MRLAASLTATFLALPLAAYADEPPVQATLGAGSGYMFHGLQLSRAGYGSVALDTTGAWHLGAQASFYQTDVPGQFGMGEVHGGWRRDTRDWSLTAELDFDSPMHGRRIDAFALLDVTLIRKAGRYWSGVDLLYTPDGPGAMRQGGGAEFRSGMQVTPQVGVHGAFGAQTVSGTDANFRWWKAGADWRPQPQLKLGLDWWDPGRHALGKYARGRFVVSLSRRFG